MLTDMTADYYAQTPTHTLHEIATVLWNHSEHAAYRALMAYIKERDNMLVQLREFEKASLVR